jgi:maltooligosyltrehalose trehalohydrolase
MNAGHEMPFGAAVQAGGGVRFRLWAPAADKVELLLTEGNAERARTLQPQDEGWHELLVPEAHAGTRYRFRLPDGLAVPDPASRFNPDGVHAASEVVDPRSHEWHDEGWRGRPWHEAVVYELHVGTFTPEGTYEAAMQRLPALRELGITAVELMPLASFPGRRGWGYDGVLPFAPQAAYGRPEDLKRFVEAAHALGLMVLLDVVYNHFGPEGNYLHAYCPEFFNPQHQTPWGAAINFDGEHCEAVRSFFVHNALYWVEEFRLDGLRMDAVHAIRDDSERHICEAIGQALRDGPGRERHVHLVLENDANQASLLARDEQGRPRIADAQWNDDFHHAAHVLATGETDGYYADYAERPLERFGRTLAEGFAYQGEPSALRNGEARGEPSAHLPFTAFVDFLQNHDQIGNRAFGDRIAALAAQRSGGRERLEALHACLLLAPAVPMLFMGEEWAASTPFLYFCDFGPELAGAVSKGRREEFKRFAAFADEAARQRIPDPNDEATFRQCVLRWDERDSGEHVERLRLVRELLALRVEQLVPRLAGAAMGARHEVADGLLRVDWLLGDGAVWRMELNLGEAPRDAAVKGRSVYALRADAQRLLPNGVRVSIEEAAPKQAAAVAEAEQDAEDA